MIRLALLALDVSGCLVLWLLCCGHTNPIAVHIITPVRPAQSCTPMPQPPVEGMALWHLTYVDGTTDYQRIPVDCPETSECVWTCPITS